MNVPYARAQITVNTPERMGDLGRRLAALLRPGDLVLLTGELGAGKTTLTRGLGAGLDVRGAVTSPTFVIARVHPPLGDGPPLVHVDAYRLGGGLDEMEDLDLDVSLPESVVVVEWGDGKVEELSDDRLHVVIERAVGAEGELAAPHPAAPAPRAETAAMVPPADVPEPIPANAAGPAVLDVDAATTEAEAEVADVRRVTVTGVGARWAGVDLSPLEG
ncbi:tRNA (adenosine(37)-N6)-threonylcarbamoyltransferase complex ATPase subunit type 1 TsaE [Streptomyces sp. 71268]|uniref:tRNA (adenosine(37)-N6)-threonylcarbamoyltransferase complex ATPase subunit type 1 TsaE n=1 Tax=Streptomyces sp. 71268 TaxID=3002640 RepID=UPI0023F63295|nr:tRNA (adenosine(37)-N6)-threonylcarbamoyltransferase complex ATPase subunit type 1 TsaE [Streptomyces sp. 71268]WEV25950.1 tRNA (adenosine(37)-N6)-threonylcarbamoyltransferase complex ATPase subunit type 1 TsaE [Streptomyces sp. 71268]